MFNKGGQAWKPFIWGIIIILVFFLLGFFINEGTFNSWFGDVSINTQTEQIGDHVQKPSWNWLTYIFGGVPAWLTDYGVAPSSALIITIAIFFLLFVTFGDVIQNFSSFGPQVSWISAFLVAIIAANLKLSVTILSVAVGIFAPLGGLAVLSGLVAAFVAFFFVNWGVGRFGPWVMRRKAMMLAQREDIKTQQGAENVASAIQGMKKIGKSLSGRRTSGTDW